MSTLPFMPLYVTTYEGHTSHLSLEEDGFYNRLLRLLWRSPGCSIPDDPRWIMRQMRIDAETFHRVGAPIIAEFCSKKNGKITQRRLLAEWIKAKGKYDARKEAGKKGGRAKALKDAENASVKTDVLPYQSEPELQSEERISNSETAESSEGVGGKAEVHELPHIAAARLRMARNGGGKR
ncbi:MAG: YdaU family protein [Nitratireductor sp.]|nr:YdaU family protein [Nitratireductor sp.]